MATRLLFLALLSGSAWAACPCLSAYPSGISPADGVTIGGQTYFYPSNYGLGSCTAHDLNLAPYCNTGTTSEPGWCADSWCYVDQNNCDKPVTESHYFTGGSLYFSYFNCGNQNTFTSWFGLAGANTTGAQGQTLANLVGVMHAYLQSSTIILEETVSELSTLVASNPNLCSSVNPGCPCTGCSTLNTFNNASLNFAQTSTSYRPGASNTSTDAVLERCMSSSLSSNFLKTAGAESDLMRIGYVYGGFQSLGTYTQWPATDTCSWDYDPRYRPWYVAAASGPKDVVIIIDVSGSMDVNGRLGLAKTAATALIDTLTDSDYVNLITFSSDATIAPFGDGAHLVQATPSTREAIKAYISTINAAGTTNFNAALSNAMDLLENPYLTSGCTKTVLFLSDGAPTPGSWDDAKSSSIQSRAAAVGARIFTYALGAQAPTAELKAIACANKGALWTVGDNGNLKDAMADYYTFLAPLNPPCQVRWRGYNDSITGEPLLAACLPAYKKSSAGAATSCAGGTAGQVPELLGVTCMDVSLIVSQATLDARPDASAFYDLVAADQAACAATTPTEVQLQTLRQRIDATQFGDAVCEGVDFSPPPPPPTPTSIFFEAIVSGDLNDITSAIETELKDKVAASLSGVSSADVSLAVSSASVMLVFQITTTTAAADAHIATINSLMSTNSDASTFLTTASYTPTVESVTLASYEDQVGDVRNFPIEAIIGGAAALVVLAGLYYLWKKKQTAEQFSNNLGAAAQAKNERLKFRNGREGRGAEGQVSAAGTFSSAAEPVPMAQPVGGSMYPSPNVPMGMAVA